VKTILIVDDESSIRFFHRRILESAGFEVLEAEHGAAALERAKQSPPDLVVTDLMMPVMTGQELIERLRTDPATAGIPIVVASANPRSALAEADAVLWKPFAADELLSAARSLTEDVASLR
jgi:CheY-like chemotaxis protein